MNRCTGFDSPLGVDRRQFLSTFGMGLGSIALADLTRAAEPKADPLVSLAHHAPKAKRVIFLFQSGGPSQIDLFDHKPQLIKQHGEQLPDSVRKGQRLTGMSGNQASLPLVGSPFEFKQHGESGAWVSDLLPYTAKVADELCFVKSMYTEAINHGPGVTFMQSGSQLAGRPSIGSWLDYGLGSLNDDLPSFVVMVTKNKGGQPLVSRLWGSGFLPGKHDGVRLRPDKNAVLYLNSPGGVARTDRRKLLDRLRELHEFQLEQTGDPALETRIAQYEMAFNMQKSIPGVTDLSDEPESTFKLYGEDARKPGTFAAHCLLARRLAERDVRFIQLYHPGWDQHDNLPGAIRTQCRETDQPSAALVQDLKARGLLEDTLVIWGGEFGRTNYCQGKLTATNFGRDHHPRCFTMWMAGGGVKPGISHGVTDDFSYNVVDGGVHIHDFHATLLHLLGIDHERLTYKYQGRHFRLTDVHGHVVKDILA
ncbi:DUF1501 domain-containing protein [Haloferula sp. A504]|uniref:DUF1501 domain-containing protein n=1 Tax=Haloferula sp. A504 TaxID=3373601 RepID=UPI0031C07B8B|nr:DUF1501 domain-containing protein [Verrucomicrobiaceae bacterium E54]